MMLNQIPQLKTICSLARKKKQHVYLVGGFLRDSLLGAQKPDLDFAVDHKARQLALRFAKEIRGTYINLDEERGCARVAKKVRGALMTYDFADFRAKTFRDDISHRDFTINTLAVELNPENLRQPLTDVLIDQKQGLKDLKAKKIRMVSPEAYREDPLRMMRAFSLQASLGFSIDRQALRQMKRDLRLIHRVAAERVREEFFKVLESSRAGATLTAMDQAGILEQVIPQVQVMYGCKQGGYHHLDVWRHSLETVKQLERVLDEFRKDEDARAYLEERLGSEHTRQSLLKLAALLHDIGKPDTRRKEKERVSFHGHEHVGRNITRKVSVMLKLSTKQRHALEDMVLWHLRPGYLANFKKPSQKAVYRYFRDTKEEAVSIALLAMADQKSTRGPLTLPQDAAHHERICRSLVQTYFEKKKEKPVARLINGHDLLKTLKLKPSPVFKEILTKVEEQQSLGKVTTKAQALQLARTIMKRKA